jgi:hypothetical protein
MSDEHVSLSDQNQSIQAPVPARSEQKQKTKSISRF